MNTEPLSSSGQDAADRLIPLSEAAKISGFTPAHLRLLAKQEKMWATKIDRNWVTTREAVQAYLDTNPRPGPKPKE